MKKKILIGSIIAVVILVLMSFSPSITANVSKPDVDVVEEDVATPIILVLQLITKLRNHKDIQNVETENDVLRIIEGDAELNSIYEQLSNEEEYCGCEEETTELEFTIICTFFGIIDAILFIFWSLSGVHFDWAEGVLLIIAELFNCNWA